MKWENFTFSALQEKTATLNLEHYNLVIGRFEEDSPARLHQEQYEFLGALLLKRRCLQMLEWQLGIDALAVDDMVGVVRRNLARRLGNVLTPIIQAEELSDSEEKLGNRMLGFICVECGQSPAKRIVANLIEEVQLPPKISFETALKVNHKPEVQIERVWLQDYGNNEAFRAVDAIGVVQGPTREEVAARYLETRYGADLRTLKQLPRHRHHHAPSRWATFMLPDEFATHWRLSDQDALDLMDDSKEHLKDRRTLERIGELELRADLLEYTIRFQDYGYKYADLCVNLAGKVVMPAYVSYPEDREDFLRQLVGFWRVVKHASLPGIFSELENHQKLLSGREISLPLQKQSKNIGKNSVLEYPYAEVEQLTAYFDQARGDGNSFSMDVKVDRSFPWLLESLHKLGEVQRIEWYGKKVQPEDIHVIVPFLRRARMAHQAEVSIFGMHVPEKIKYQGGGKSLRVAFNSLYEAGVKLERTAQYDALASILLVAYRQRIIILQSATDVPMAFAKRGKKHLPIIRFTICTFFHPFAQSVLKQRDKLAKRPIQIVTLQQQAALATKKTKATRYANPKTLNTKDYFKQRLSEVTDVRIKNRLDEWMKYKPDKIQQNIKVVNQPYFALLFESRKVVILDSFEPHNAYFIFYDKTLKDVVSRVIHLGSKEAVLKYSSMITRGYHDTEPIKQRARRIFTRRL